MPQLTIDDFLNDKDFLAQRPSIDPLADDLGEIEFLCKSIIWKGLQQSKQTEEHPLESIGFMCAGAITILNKINRIRERKFLRYEKSILEFPKDARTKNNTTGDN